MPHWSAPRHAASVQLMVQLAGELGVAASHCLRGTGLHERELVDPAHEIPGQQELSVLRNIVHALDPKIPFSLLAGQRYRTTMHGTWGLALITSPSVREALEVGVRYFELSYSFNRGGYEIEPNLVRLLYGDEENPEDLRSLLVERDMAALIAFQQEVLGTALPIRAVKLRSSAPAYATAFKPLFGVEPRFDADRNCIEIDSSWLGQASRQADLPSMRVSEQQCDTLLQLRHKQLAFAGQVQRKLLRAEGIVPSMRSIARELGVSTRTLRNRLQDEGASYRELVEAARRMRAEELLLTTSMTVHEIAERLGYAATSSFTTAFKRWKGLPPSDYRGGS